MRGVGPLARLYFLGALRRQVHLATMFLGVSLFMLPAFVNTLSMGSGVVDQVSKDFGLIVIGYFTVGMAVLLGSRALPDELESRSLYPILARPMSRVGLLTAHHLAITALLALSVTFLGLCVQTALGLMMRRLDVAIWPALYGSLLQAVIIAAFCIMLSVRLAPAWSSTLGVLMFLVGHLSRDFWKMTVGSGALKSCLPDLSSLALKDAAVHGLTVDAAFVFEMTLYTLGWAAVFLLLAGQAFQEVDL